jgi:hypothetical protein
MMSTSTLLLYVPETGHVLAAATVASPPAQTPKPEALAGALLPVRDSVVEVLVPANRLAVLSVDPPSTIIDQTRELIVSPVDQSLGPLAANNKVTNVTVTKNMITIALSSIRTENVSVWATIQPLDQLASASQTQSTKIVEPTQPVDLTLLPLASGRYSMLVLVSGYMPSLSTATVS